MKSAIILSKIQYLIAIVFFSYNYALGNDFEIYHLSPLESKYNDFTLPRNNLDLYRGIDSNQAPLKKVIRAMLGDSTANIESAMFFTIKQGLMKQPQHLLELTPPRGKSLKEKYNSLSLQNEIELALANNNHQAYSEDDAFKVTNNILQKVYNDAFLIKNIIDYTEPERDDFPPAFLYSSIYIEVAKIYSSNILIYNESQHKRSLDQNYWNWFHKKKWVGTVNNPFPDRAEFLTPFFIPYNQIVGYQWQRSSFSKSQLWYEWRDLKNDLTVVFMKLIENDIPHVYMFDASNLQHIVKVENQFCSATSLFNPKSEFPKMTQVDCTIKPKLIAILKMCSNEDELNNCTVNQNLFYPYSSSQNYLNILNDIKNISFNNSRIIYCTNSLNCK